MAHHDHACASFISVVMPRRQSPLPAKPGNQPAINRQRMETFNCSENTTGNNGNKLIMK